MSYNTGTTIKKILKDAIISLKESNLDINEINLIKLIDMIPMSANTVSRRTELLANDVEKQVIDEITEMPIGFSLQIDESIDISNISQLVMLVRC